MASEKSAANRRHYEAIAAQSGQALTPEQAIEWNEVHWTALSAEPRGVDYIEVDAGGIPAMWINPKGAAEDRAIFYAHGGGFVAGSIYTHRKLVGHLAKASGCRALLFDYAYAHQQKYPSQLNASLSAYRWLLERGVRPEHIAMAADSCGAILMFGTLQRARDQGLGLPRACSCISGWLDLTLSGESYDTNREKDVFFNREANGWLVANFLGADADRRDPLASPLFADLRGLPPIYLQAGADETLVDDSRMFAERAKRAGVEVRLDVFPEMLHSFQMMAGLAPEADEAIFRLAQWLRAKLGL
jgi:acetyl esterase/lipase